MKDLKGKVVVITGASSGVGRAIALEFARYGAKLVLAARRKKALTEVASECAALGAETEVMVTDTGIISEVRQLARAAREFGGTIDIWINNAGVLAAGSLEDVPPEVNEAVIRTNLLGYINGAQAVLPHFKNQEHGIIINNISVGGWFPTPYASAYTASKFGIRGFSESLKAELSNYPGIHVVDLYPGFLDTPGVHHAANFTGKALKPAPPVMDPRKVARAVIRLVKQPSSEKSIGIAAPFLHTAYSLLPKITRNITAAVIRRYLNNTDRIDHTTGNVLTPVDFGTGIDGGWRLKKTPAGIKISLAFLAGIALTGFFVGRKLRTNG